MKDAALEYINEFYRLQGIAFGKVQTKMIKVVLEDNPYHRADCKPVVVTHNMEIPMERSDGNWVAEVPLVSVNLLNEIKINFKKV